MSVTERKDRIHWIDIAKGIGVALVTFVHIPNGDGESVWLPAIAGGVYIVGLFHMPLFFVLSGFTFRLSERNEGFILKKVRTLLVPYCFFSLYALAKPVATMLVPSLSGAVGSTRDYSIAGQLFDVFVAGNGLWFLMALFVGELVVLAVERSLPSNLGAPRRQRTEFGFGLALVLLTQLRSEFVPVPFDPFQVLAGMRAAGFMLVGISVKEIVFGMGRRRSVSCVSAAVLVLSVLSLGLSDFLDVFLEVSSAFSGAALVISLSQLIAKSAPLEYVGRNSLTFYAVNALTMNVIKLVVFRILGVDAAMLPVTVQYLLSLVIIFVAFIALAIESEFIKRFLWWSIGLPRNHNSRPINSSTHEIANRNRSQ